MDRKLAFVALLFVAVGLFSAAQRGEQAILTQTVAGGGPSITAVEYICRDHAAGACEAGSGDTTTKTITLGTATTSGELIVVITLGFPDGASSGTMTDSGSQSYTKDTNAYTGLSGGHGDYTVWYKTNSASGITTVTWTPEASDVGSASAMLVAHYKGLTTTHDGANVWNATAQSTPFTGGTGLTTTNAHDLLIVPVYVDGNIAGCSDKAVTGTSGWTAQVGTTENDDGGLAELMDQVVTSTGTYNGTGTSTATGACLHAGITAFAGS